MQRIEKIDPTTLTGEPKKIFERWSPGGQPLNIVLIYFRNLDLNRNWSYMATHLFMKNSLSDRQREIIVLRISWQCASDYEFIQHVRIVREGKLMSEDEIRDLLQPELALGWTSEERALIALSDELLAYNAVTDTTWSMLSDTLDSRQLMDAIATAGGYALNSMATSSFGVDIEETMQREEGLVPSKNSRAFRFLAGQRAVTLPASARIAPTSDIDDKTMALVAPYMERGERKGLLTTIARYPMLVKDWLPIIRYVDAENTLDDETRLLVSQRTAFRCGAPTETADRKAVSQIKRIPIREIDRPVPSGAIVDSVDLQSLLVRAVDELIDDMVIGDEVWVPLKHHFGDEQVMDIVFAVATELMVCWMLNALGVQTEPSQ